MADFIDTTVAPKRARALKIPPLSEAEIATANGSGEIVRITSPNLGGATIKVVGIAPYVQHAFSEKARKQMVAIQRAGQQARGKKTREPKQFEEIYKAAMHLSREGWHGIPAPAFRNACIDACRLVGFKMTHAKLSLFVEADGYDIGDGTPLVRIFGKDNAEVAQPHIAEHAVRNASGVADIRWRPMWDEGWGAAVRVTWDKDQFSATDIHNLLQRAGQQVGIGEGRPNSPNSNGLGWGRFTVVI